MVMVKQDGKWKRAALTNYENEAELRDLLAGSPDLVPGCAGTVAMTELTVPGAGSADVVLVDQSGAITIVEAKLASNPQVRREVVGQIFAYASGLQGMPFDEFVHHAEQRLRRSFVAALEESASQPLDAEEVRRRITETLTSGSFRLVVAVDEITDELKRIIEYLNEHLGDRLAIMALELGVLKIEGTEVLVPATYGAEIQQPSARGGSKRAWTHDEVVAAWQSVAPGPARQLLDQLWTHAQDKAATFKGGVGASPSAGVYYQLGDDTRSLWSVWFPESGPRVAINLGSITAASEGAARHVLALIRGCPELDQALGLPSDDDEAIGKYPSVALAQLDPAGCAMKTIYSAIDAAASGFTA